MNWSISPRELSRTSLSSSSSCLAVARGSQQAEEEEEENENEEREKEGEEEEEEEEKDLEAAFQSFLEETSPPDDMLCPLSLSLMRDSVTAADSYSYERTDLEAQIVFAESKGRPLVSPMTNLPMASVFDPSMYVKRQVQEFVEEKRREWEEGGREAGMGEKGKEEEKGEEKKEKKEKGKKGTGKTV